jgi:DNA-binding transcriptional regulator YiaG
MKKQTAARAQARLKEKKFLESSKNLRAIREYLELTQADFGEAIGVIKSTVSDYENGRSRPDPTTARAIVRLAVSRGMKIALEYVYPAEEGER